MHGCPGLGAQRHSQCHCLATGTGLTVFVPCLWGKGKSTPVRGILGTSPGYHLDWPYLFWGLIFTEVPLECLVSQSVQSCSLQKFCEFWKWHSWTFLPTYMMVTYRLKCNTVCIESIRIVMSGLERWLGMKNFLYKNEDMSSGSQIHKNTDAKVLSGFPANIKSQRNIKSDVKQDINGSKK